MKANARITEDESSEPTSLAPKGAKLGAAKPARAARRKKKQPRANSPTRQYRKRSASWQAPVTNGKEILPGVDARSVIARRYYDISAAIISDQGGPANMTECRIQLVRRFAAAAVLAELMEAKLASGGEIDVHEHAYLTSTLCRIVQRIGIDRRSRDVTPTLKDILSDPSLGEQLTDAQDEADEMAEDAGAWS